MQRLPPPPPGALFNTYRCGRRATPGAAPSSSLPAHFIWRMLTAITRITLRARKHGKTTRKLLRNWRYTRLACIKHTRSAHGSPFDTHSDAWQHQQLSAQQNSAIIHCTRRALRARASLFAPPHNIARSQRASRAANSFRRAAHRASSCINNGATCVCAASYRARRTRSFSNAIT